MHLLHLQSKLSSISSGKARPGARLEQEQGKNRSRAGAGQVFLVFAIISPHASESDEKHKIETFGGWSVLIVPTKKSNYIHLDMYLDVYLDIT